MKRQFIFSASWSLFFTTIAFLPLLRHLASPIIFTYGDGFAQWMPEIIKLHRLLAHGIFSGMDWGVSNGAGDFFLLPHLYIYYPPVFVGSLLLPLNSMHNASVFLNLLFFLQALICCIAVQNISISYFSLKKENALLIAVLYTFSYSSLFGLYMCPFYVTTTLFPIVIWLSLNFFSKKTRLSLLLATFINVCCFLSGYLPLSVFAIISSYTFINLYYFYIKKSPLNIHTFLYMAIPFVIAGLIVSSYYLAVLTNPGSLNPDLTNLDMSAHMLSIHPSNIFWVISSPFLTYPHTAQVEQIVSWGLIPLLLLILILFNKNFKFDSNEHVKLFKVCAFSYLSMLAICFGIYLPLSDVFHSFFPGLGSMHIYSRYLMMQKLFFCIGIGLVFSSLVEKSCLYRQGILSIIVVLFFIALFVANSNTYGNSNYLCLECWVAIAFFILLLKINRPTPLFSFVAFLPLIALGYFIFSLYTPSDNIMSVGHAADKDKFIQLIDQSPKQLVKFANLTEIPYSFIPRDYPWFYNAAHEKKISNYYGYDLDSSIPPLYKKYFRYFGIVDWDWMKKTGIDYVIYDPKYFKIYEEEIKENTDYQHPIAFSNGEYLVKVSNLTDPKLGNILFDNGYLRIFSQGHTNTKNISVRYFSIKDGHEVHIKFTNTTPITLLYPFYPSTHIHLYVNGAERPFETDDHLFIKQLAPGNYDIEILYKNTLLSLFLVVFFTYLVSMIIYLFVSLIRRLIS